MKSTGPLRSSSYEQAVGRLGELDPAEGQPENPLHLEGRNPLGGYAWALLASRYPTLPSVASMSGPAYFS
jgi:hypothetical protein